MSNTLDLRVPAIEVTQGPGRVLYSFAIDGKALPSFATVSRIRRGDGAGIEGYQRPEVLSHIAEIRGYVESEAPRIPNAIVIAFDGRVRFEPLSPGKVDGLAGGDYTRTGYLVIPLCRDWTDTEKPGFVVDGQQRLAAIRDAHVDRFPICITAFITDDVQDQTEQFILVNSTKPLPKGLIYELLPYTEARLPTLLHRRRFPSRLLERLNRDEDSPLKDLIQTPTTPTGVVKDNSVLRMLENSLNEGVLYRFRNHVGVRDDGAGERQMLAVLKAFWGAVARVFNDAWGLPPRRCRLMHGAGVVSLGFIMDAICERHGRIKAPTLAQFEKDLSAIADICRWTDGYWDFGPNQQRKWNEIQNTSKDIQLLANHLLLHYKAKVWSRGKTDNGEGKKRATQARLVF